MVQGEVRSLALHVRSYLTVVNSLSASSAPQITWLLKKWVTTSFVFCVFNRLDFRSIHVIQKLQRLGAVTVDRRVLNLHDAVGKQAIPQFNDSNSPQSSSP